MTCGRFRIHIKAIEEAGLRERTKIIVGDAPVGPSLASASATTGTAPARHPAPIWPNNSLALRKGDRAINKPSDWSNPPLPIVVIACQVLQDLLERLLPADLAEQVTFMDYGLHRVPSRMTWTLQETIDSIPEPSLVVLGYGLCGNGLKDLRSGKHTLLIPRTDDCIALLLGSYQAYMREFQAVPGTYYLTKGWLESGSNPLQEYEEYRPKYGDKEAMWIMDQQYQHYERLVLVAHTQADMEKYRAQAQEIGRFCERWNMRYEEILGSDDYVRRLVEAADALNDGSPPLDRLDGDFVVIAPNGQVQQDLFMR